MDYDAISQVFSFVRKIIIFPLNKLTSLSLYIYIYKNYVRVKAVHEIIRTPRPFQHPCPNRNFPINGRQLASIHRRNRSKIEPRIIRNVKLRFQDGETERRVGKLERK